MPEKPLAVILTSLFAAPLVLICCLGPGLVVAFVGSIGSWFAGVDLSTALVVGLGAAVVARSVVRARRRRTTAVTATAELLHGRCLDEHNDEADVVLRTDDPATKVAAAGSALHHAGPVSRRAEPGPAADPAVSHWPSLQHRCLLRETGK